MSINFSIGESVSNHISIHIYFPVRSSKSSNDETGGDLKRENNALGV